MEEEEERKERRKQLMKKLGRESLFDYINTNFDVLKAII